MPLIEIWNYDRSIKKMIQANSLNMLIKEGALKLGYRNQSILKVVIESDGTDVDAEDVFSALVAENMFPATVLLMLPDDHSWSNMSTNLATTAFLPVSLPSVPQPDPVADAISISEDRTNVTSVFTVPYINLPKRFIIDCDKNKMPEKHLVRKTIRTLAEALIKFNPMPERALIRVVAQDIVGKYPVLGSPNTGGTHKCYETIFTKLENCVHNLRRPIKWLEMEYAKGKNAGVKKLRPKKDKYGCVKWQPILPENETQDTQEIARKSLLEYHKTSSTDINNISAAMSQTYATQRLLINSKALVHHIEKSWPYLFQRTYFIEHANKLLGMNLLSVWNDSLKKVPSLMSYFRTLRKRNESMDKLLSQLEEAVVRQQSRMSELSALVLLLSTYFGEQESQILNYFDVATSLDDIRTRKQNDKLMHPSICILGNSLLNNCKGYVLVENVVVGDLEDIIDLMPILFTSFYVFNLCYPPGAEATLEFLQREFFKINPPGHKRGGKKKRTTVHPKVATLQFNLQHHNSQWGHVDDDSDNPECDLI